MPLDKASIARFRSGWRELFEHDQQGEADRVGEHCLVLRITGPAGRASPGVPGHRAGPGRRLRGTRPGITDRFLAPVPARPEHVQGYPRDNCRQPAAETLDLAGIRASQPQPGVLDRVVGVCHRAEQPVGHRPQVIAVLLEGGCQPGAVAHLSHSLVAGCHHLDTRHPADMTCIAPITAVRAGSG